jgi:WD40 repeat protein
MTSVGTAHALSAPYRGLAPFGDSELDALLFFGRERETEIAVANLIAARLTILYGPSGVGKSSLLRAGVARRIRELGARRAVGRGPDVAIVVFASWAEDPVRGLADAIEAEVAPLVSPLAPRPPEGSSLADVVEHWSALLDGDLCIVLDQLEEHFVYHEDEDGPGTLVGELPEVVLRSTLRANVLLSLRDDALARLDVFKGRIPNLFANYLRLDRLDRDAARAAIIGPVQRWNELTGPGEHVEIEPELVDDVVAQASVEGDADRVEPPYLQLVMERLWNEEHEAGSRLLRRSTLTELGGAGAIVRDHLDRALGALDDDEQAAAARMFEHLVTPSGTKIAHRSSDLAEFAHLGPGEARPVLTALGRERILRPLDETDGDRYEIFHDVLADAIIDWRRRRDVQHELDDARRRHRRLVAVAGASLAALVLVAGVAIYALTQRTEARNQTRHAQARELSARALLLQGVDPSKSLALALRAAQLAPAQDTEDVLRSSLLASHVRSVLPVRAPVRAVAYSPDGRRVATAGADGLVRIWNLRGGGLVRTLHAGGPAAVVSYDPSGRRILTVGGGTTVVWNAAGRGSVLLPGSGTEDAAFVRGRSAVVTAGSGGVTIRRARDGAPLRRFLGSKLDVRAVLSRDGRILAAIGGDPVGHVLAWIYDVSTGRLVHRLPQRGVSDVEFSPGGLLAVGSRDGSTTLWQPRTGRLVRTLDDGGTGVNDLAFSPDGTFLATAADDGGVRIWRPDVGDRFFFFLGHTNPVVHVAWSPNGQYVVSASSDRTARVQKVAGIPLGETAVLAGHDDAVRAAVFAPDGRTIVTGSDDGTARVWDAGFEQQLARMGAHAAPADAASFSPDGRLAVSAGADGTARLWDVRRHRLLAVLRHRGHVRSASFGADGQRVVTAADDRTARVWTRDGTLVSTLRHRSAVVGAALSADGSLVVTATSDGTIALWHPNGRLVGRHDRGIAATDVAFTPDGRAIVSAGADGIARIWSVRPFRVLHVLRGHRGPIVRLDISPDGKTIVTAGSDGTARLWSIDGRPLHTLHGHTAALTDARFDSTGARVVTTSADKDGRIWDVRTGRPRFTLRGTFSTVNAGAFSPDGRWVVTGGPVSAALWSAETGRLVFYVRPEAKTRITDVEFSPDGGLILASADDGGVGLYRCDVCGDIGDLEALAAARLQRERNGVRRAGG